MSSSVQTHEARYAGRLLAAVRDETAAHLRLIDLLRSQEANVTRPGNDAFRAATDGLQAELARVPHRAKKRAQILKDLAGVFGVSVKALTIGSAVERLGDRGVALGAARTELQAAAIETRRLTLRVGALVRMHREVTRDLLQVVLGGDEQHDVAGGGTLIDAEI